MATDREMDVREWLALEARRLAGKFPGRELAVTAEQAEAMLQSQGGLCSYSGYPIRIPGRLERGARDSATMVCEPGQGPIAASSCRLATRQARHVREMFATEAEFAAFCSACAGQ